MRVRMRRARGRLTYANVMSSIAVFVALGGTSYALTLPRNSVGSAQIRTGAVGPTEIRTGAIRSRDVGNRSLGLQDLSLAARSSLRGRVGEQGPPGPPGPTYTAAVTGWVRRSEAMRSGPIPGPQRIGRRLRPQCRRLCLDCNLANVDGTVPPPGRVTVGKESGRVVVRTYNAAGDPQRLPFHLIVAC